MEIVETFKSNFRKLLFVVVSLLQLFLLMAFLLMVQFLSIFLLYFIRDFELFFNQCADFQCDFTMTILPIDAYNIHTLFVHLNGQTELDIIKQNKSIPNIIEFCTEVLLRHSCQFLFLALLVLSIYSYFLMSDVLNGCIERKEI